MKDVTNRYRRAVTSSNREFLYEAKITFADGNRLTLNDKDDLMGDGISITAGTSGIDSFDIGAAVMGELVLTLNNSMGKFDLYDFFDAQINIKIGLRIEDTVEYLQMGIYTVEEANVAETTITISALDKMSWFERTYSEVQTVYPKTLYGIVKDICDHCGVVFSGTHFPDGDRVIPNRTADGEISCLQMISYVAQVAGCYAVITGEGQLAFRWYDTSVFEEMDSLDGGKLKNAATGDKADGGNFTDYSSGDAVDGGAFIDQRRYAHIYAMGSMQIATDEIVITGIRVVANEEEEEVEDTEDAEDAEDTEDTEEIEEVEDTGAGEEEENAGILYGEEGYVLLVSENPLITKDMEGSVAEELGNKIIGMKIRTFSVSALSDPAIEAGDCAYISDRKGNSYPAYITNIIFKMGNYEEFSCGAQSPARNRTEGSTAETKAIIRARKEIKKQLTAYDVMVQQLTELMANSFGVFKTEEKQSDGSFIHYMHDKPSLKESNTIWKMVSGAITVSTDGGKNWNAGMTSDGNLVVKVLSAIGVNADWIKAGEISSVSINIGDGSFVVDEEGNVKITKGSIAIGEYEVIAGNGQPYMKAAFSVNEKGELLVKDAVIEGEILGIRGFSLQYDNINTRPVMKKVFTFATVGYETPYGDTIIGENAFLDLRTPHGTRCAAMGIARYGEEEVEEGIGDFRDTIYFPNGACIHGAFIESLHQTYKKIEKITNDNEWVELSVRNSGAFICVYGTYHTYEQKAGESKEIVIGEKKSLYTPTYAPVRAVGMSGKRTFVFQISTDGKFTARNTSELDYSSESAAGIRFRFDFFKL